jgi:hypothetical protein
LGRPAALADMQEIAPSQTTAHRSVQRLASGRIFIRWLGWNETSRARAIEPPGNRNFYTSRWERSQREPRGGFPRCGTLPRDIRTNPRLTSFLNYCIYINCVYLGRPQSHQEFAEAWSLFQRGRHGLCRPPRPGVGRLRALEPRSTIQAIGILDPGPNCDSGLLLSET